MDLMDCDMDDLEFYPFTGSHSNTESVEFDCSKFKILDETDKCL